MFSLGIEIKPELLARQVGWFAPTHQPFLVPKKRLNSIGMAPASGELQAEVRDTFEIYNVADDLVCVRVGGEEFNHLAHAARADLVRSQIRLKRGVIPSVRAAPAGVRDQASMQADGHRFVWWPSLLAGHYESVLGEYLRFGRQSSRHMEIPENLWENTHATLPGARALAGTFPHASGPKLLWDCHGGSWPFGSHRCLDDAGAL